MNVTGGDPGEKPEARRTKHPVAKAIGAVFKGYRDGDQQVRDRVNGFGRKFGRVSVTIAALTFAGQALSLVSTVIKQSSDDRRALVVALGKQSEKIGVQTDKIALQTERIGDLVDVLKDDRARRDEDHRRIIDALPARGRR